MNVYSHVFSVVTLSAAIVALVACNNGQGAQTQEPMGPVYEAQGGQQQQGQEQMGQEQMGQEQMGQEQMGQEQMGQEQMGQEQMGQEQMGQEQMGQGMAAAVQTAEQQPYGAYLVDKDNRTLYMFTADKQNDMSACYDKCAEAWPPLTTTEDPRVAAPNLDPKMLGTITRKDGTKQVTYGGWPLYYYVKDQGPQMVKGQDIRSFGGEWYLVAPDGSKIEATQGTKPRT